MYSDDDRFTEAGEDGEVEQEASLSAAATRSKRTREVEDRHSESTPAKKKCLCGQDDGFGFEYDEFAATPEPDNTPDPSCQLPPPSDTIIRLRFQLCRFKGVYRVVRLPLSFTFAHLYRLTLLLFSWSGHHLHQAEVVTHAELYSTNYREGEIKKHRSFRIPEEPDKEENINAWREWLFQYAPFTHDPAMRVTPGGSRAMRERRPEPEPENEWDAFMDKMEVAHKKDAEVTLGDLWAKKSKYNFTKGKCHNKYIGIHFQDDLGCECCSVSDYA